LCAVQGGNWQRGGGKGRQPEQITRPSDTPPAVRSGAELNARRAAMDAREKPWQPVKRQRIVSAALKAYALLTTSAANGAVRDLEKNLR